MAFDSPPLHPPESRRAALRPSGPRAYDRDDRSIGDLFKELMHETRTLVRQELHLARTEAEDKVTKAGRHARYMAVGGLVAYAGFLALVAALGYLLGTFLPLWLGFLIAGAAVLLVGGVFYQKGRQGIRTIHFSLERTAETLQEDTLWIKQEAQDIADDPSHLGARA
jgi:hypothetical protein